jgi:hypothetical protein
MTRYIDWHHFAKCTQSKDLGIFTVLECTPPLNTEVVLIKIIWGIMAHVLGLFWICSLFCQITLLGFGMDVVANISCYVCVKIPWKNLEHQHFLSFLGTSLKSWFCWEPKHLTVSWVNFWDLLIKWQPVFNFIHFWPKLLPQCTLPNWLKIVSNGANQCILSWFTRKSLPKHWTKQHGRN